MKALLPCQTVTTASERENVPHRRAIVSALICATDEQVRAGVICGKKCSFLQFALAAGVVKL